MKNLEPHSPGDDASHEASRTGSENDPQTELALLRAELAEARARIAHLEKLADADPLLGVLNRRALLRELERARALVDRHGAPACLFFADLDELKRINDDLGHGAGDLALAHVAATLVENVRKTDSVGRLGGDEFGVVLAFTEEEAAWEKTRALARQVENAPILWNGFSFAVSISCGVAPIVKGATSEEILAAADRAMYENKRRRRA